MYEDVFESIRQAAEKRNLRERTIQLYCSNVSYFLRCTNKPVTDLALGDADAFLTMKRLEGRSPETHNHYRASIKFVTMPPAAAQMIMKAVGFLFPIHISLRLLYPYSGDTGTLQSTL